MTRVLATLGLAALYVGTLGSLALADVVVGLLVGALLAYFATGRRGLGGVRASLGKVLRLPWFLFGVVLEVLQGSVGMALVILGVRDWRRQGFVEVTIGSRTSVGITVSSLVAGLSPGSVVVDVDEEKHIMLLHVIDASDAEVVRARLADFYRRYQARVFP